jgi:hypothetical protein
MVFYNKAYNQYRCVLLHPTSFAEASACSQKANRAIATYVQLTTQYFSTVAVRSPKCEMQARLFEAEIEFPPYSFLKGKGAKLFDHARMVECLRN